MDGYRARRFVATALAMIVSMASVPAQASSTAAAQTATETWLSLVDKQEYAAGWEAASASFRSAVTRDQWQSAVRAARTPLGQLESRKLKTATIASMLPGMPDGEYVVFQFDARFSAGAMVETVTASREKDGTWRVAGYYVK